MNEEDSKNADATPKMPISNITSNHVTAANNYESPKHTLE